LDISSVKQNDLPDMAVLFVENFKQLRAAVPILPDLMEDPHRVAGMLSDMPGIVARDAGKVVGYMLWYLVDDFRGTPRKGAYVPEQGHGAANPQIYRAMYRAAAEQWAEAGCEVHAISLLAPCDDSHRLGVREVWFWNGFGLTGVDAIRTMKPLGIAAPGGITIRVATLDDLEGLVTLEVEHSRHYRLPPISMMAHETKDAVALATIIGEPDSRIWIAVDGGTPIGFINFERNSFGAAVVVDAPDKIHITGTYVRPQYRGQRIGGAILDAALRDYAARGFARCSVDFEAFNPEAAAFWTKYFDVVCLSVTRVPECI
jgi:GNAT superfamily N-acetyltransferase